jgi:hypothetical protein
MQTWQLSNSEGQWDTILGEYLEKVAQRCTDEGDCVIGHIKALSTFSDHSYLRISVVAAHIPANIEGKVPAGVAELDLTVNVLVFGLERALIEKITRDTANEIASRWKGVVY